MKVTIEGDTLAQIRDGCMTVARVIKPRSKSANHQLQLREKRRRKNDWNKERRTLIKRAFDLIRHDPAQKALTTALAKALGGSARVTDDLLASAHQIVAAHQ